MKKYIKNNNRFSLLLLLILFIGTLTAFKIYDDGDDFELAKSFDLFHDVVREVRMYYVDDVDVPKLIGEATKEFLQKLDPYTVFYPENQIEDYKLMTTGAYGGIGASIFDKKETLLISNINKNSPADSSGLKVGDEIIAVNGIYITKQNISEIRKNLKGEPGSEIHLIINRFGLKNPTEKIIVRKKIISPLIPFTDIIDGKSGYIKLNSFLANSSNEFRKKLKDLNEKQKLSGLIIDLRENPGGLLNEAVNIVNLFVPKGSEIVSTKGRVKSWNHDYKAKKDPLFPDLPLVVLINSHSASASEIVSGALQDLDRAVIIGQRSFGKGLVQITRKTEYNTRIKITTAKYYIPSGRCIQAIDYSHRNPDGSIGNVPDSLISEFKTQNGRKVYDGGGIEPDIRISEKALSKFTEELLRNFEIFDFSTKYYYEHEKIPPVNEFTLNNSVYNEFIKFVEKNNYNFQSEAGIIAEKLAETAENEHYEQEIILKIKELQKELSIDKANALMQFKEEIIPILEREIIKRYYYGEGMIRDEMKFDRSLKKAKIILSDKEKYQKILSGIND
ncbi:MAG: S41 family peptidase [Bacteroidales bacterium]|nr:S41 family peptidase [Bacteroidales bacterium]